MSTEKTVGAETDRIEKTLVVHAPRSRVWRAITNTDEFGAWFGVALEGAFMPDARITGRITTPGYDHLSMEIVVDRIEPERLFSFRWHPYAVDPAADYSAEPMTLVEFVLDQVPEGTSLTVIESGFDRIPLARRGNAFRMNSEGWSIQLANVGRYVAQ
jgi:uncharacterized protein YndB with AHSA1/START domain